MDLDLLPTFAVFAETLSFTETGRRLGLTQPAVHGQVRRLAEATGDPLYVRQGRSLRLTPRGEALAALALDVLTRRDAFFGAEAPLRLAAGRGAWLWLVVDQLGPWLREHAVQPVLADGPTAEKLVRGGKVELGISTSPSSDLAQIPLWEVGTDVLLPMGHRLAEASTLTTADLGEERWVLPSAGRAHRTVVEALLQRAGHSPKTVLSCDDWALTARFVGLGLGIAAVNDCVRTEGVHRVPWVDGPRHTYRMFWRRGLEPPAVQELRHRSGQPMRFRVSASPSGS